MTPSPPRVRRANPGDLPRLDAIQRAALAEPWPLLLDPDGPLAPRLWVVEDDGVRGYAAVVAADGPTAYLAEIAVEPARQREGLGSRLLDASLADLGVAGFERVRLTAPADDEGLRRFYDSHGFEPVGCVEDHFQTGDGLVMERGL